MIQKVLFHFICSIGRLFRKIFQTIFGRRHEELGTSLSRTEPVTLEHIRIINDMENDSTRPYQSFTSLPKVPPQPEWTSWGSEDIFRQKALENHSPTDGNNDDQIDYFSDIAATVKKTPKIILKKRVNENDDHFNFVHPSTNRLQMINDDLTDFQPGLNEWQEGGERSVSSGAGIWNENDDFSEVLHDADAALRESRRLEREKKLREHQQRKFEKEASRTSSHKRDSLS
ncbi:unnamed protein product [Adineta ricciae]|uniref:Receptor-binding cancer antigen n=1 Tax=Adineta ricciae TaxID=249248 RepID=A0A814VYP9_ADIRI|nr:unnamed protein product [Adineta ricciae]